MAGFVSPFRPNLSMVREGSESRGEVNVPLSYKVVNYVGELLAGWQPDGSFDFQSRYNYERFYSIVREHVRVFNKPNVDEKSHLGYVSKFDFEDESVKIFLQASFYGNLEGLLKTLNALQKEGILDEQYRCAPDTHLVFLGNYTGAKNSTEVLELLMLLHQENPFHIHLLRGKGESPFVENNEEDEVFSRFLSYPPTARLLHEFGEGLPLSLFMCIAGAEKREYLQISPAALDPSTDISMLLDAPPGGGYLVISKRLGLKRRAYFASNDPKHALYRHAKRMKDIMNKVEFGEKAPYSSCSRGHISERRSHYYPYPARRFSLSYQDVFHWQRLCSDQGHSIQYMVYNDEVDNHEYTYRGESRLMALSQVKISSMFIHLNKTIKASGKRFLIKESGQFSWLLPLTRQLPRAAPEVLHPEPAVEAVAGSDNESLLKQFKELYREQTKDILFAMNIPSKVVLDRIRQTHFRIKHLLQQLPPDAIEHRKYQKAVKGLETLFKSNGGNLSLGHEEKKE